LWAVRGEGARGERVDRLTGERQVLTPSPSKAAELSHSFSSVTRFFSGGRDILAAIDDEISRATLGIGREGSESNHKKSTDQFHLLHNSLNHRKIS